MKITATSIGHTLLILLVLYCSYLLVTDPNPWTVFDYVNLLIHEAGHLLLWPLGEFMHILGGSLLQITFPLSFFVYFLRRGEYFSAAFIIFWVADNVINVSVYMRDAVAMQLPLLGGDSSGHDWNQLLTMTGLLLHTELLANITFFFGVMGLFIGIVGMGYFTLKQMSEEV